MLPASDKERQDIFDYMASQARDGDREVEFIQKVYTERLHSITHDIWDVHESDGRRWWVITEPTNLYSQEQFPNMDLALTFHVGLCLRIPRSDRPLLSESQAEPFMACWRGLDDARAAFDRAEETGDFQAVGVRCREALVTLVHAAQDMLETSPGVVRPKRSDVRAWAGLIADQLFAGESHRERRAILKTSADSAWAFTNWLAHARGAQGSDVEAALEVTQLAASLYTTALIRHMRGVPARCPSCGSHRLSPERADDRDSPDDLYERPACQKCGWTGTPVLVPPAPPRRNSPPPTSECIIPDRPLRNSPGRKRPRKA